MSIITGSLGSILAFRKSEPKFDYYITNTISMPCKKDYAIQFREELIRHSIYKDDPIPEWEVIRIDGGNGSCICGMYIKNLYTIKNKNTNEELVIGSECQEKWNVRCNVSCEKCNSPLGNLKKRFKERNYICPECAREQRRIQKRIAKLQDYTMYLKGPWYNLSFKEVATLQTWVEKILNNPAYFESKTYSYFEEYCGYIYEIEETE